MVEPRAGSLTSAIDLENRNQLLVRLTTQNLEEAIRARKQKRKPKYQDCARRGRPDDRLRDHFPR